MKKLLLLFSFISLFQISNASHIRGGEIRWECLSNGRFVFFAKLYRDCTGIPINYYNLQLDIVGNPLPQSANNASFSSIVMKPDSSTWANNRNGDISPECSVNGSAISCVNHDPGSIQQFFYQSDPIILKGTPPADGWKFFMQIVCCRPNVTNLSAGGTMMLRATMFPNKQRTPTDVCFDSSPEFLATPVTMLCRGTEVTMNNTAIDKDLDSMVFAFDRTYNVPPVAPQPVPYAAGYSFNNPSPDKSFNNLNIPSTIDPVSGKIRTAIYNGVGSLDYLIVVRANSYREGTLIASVYRELPIEIVDCPLLSTGQKNNRPKVLIDGDTTESKTIDVVAGQRLKVPIQVTDFDVVQGFPTQQKITLEPSGILFSKDLQDTANCQTSLLAPCAILRNQRPTWNNVAEPPRWEIAGFQAISTEFIWDPGCQHISTVGTGISGQNEGIFNFVFKVSDDHCPIPVINYPTITVRLRDPFPLAEPIMKGVSVGLDGRLTYSWVPPIDSAKSFHAYEPKIARVLKGTTPSIWQDLRMNLLRKYEKSQSNMTYTIFNTVPGNPNKLNILDKILGQDYYLRMTSISGCTDDVKSIPSEPARIMDLEVMPTGIAPDPLRSQATLNWNAPKLSNAASKPYFVYESTTKYYVWENDDIDLNGNKIDSIASWFLRDSTYQTTIDINSISCGEYSGFRIEARDTVISWKQGATIGMNDSLDTLVFSTFSVIDTLLMSFGSSAAYSQEEDFLYTSTIYNSFQWVDCKSKSAISGAVNNTFIPNYASDYAVVVSLGNCFDTSNCFSIVPTDTSVTLVNHLELRSNAAGLKYQWIDCRADTIIPGANDQNFFPEDSGFYAVVLSRYGMKDTSSCFAMLSIGLDEIDWATQISIFPNPFKNELHIQSNLNEVLNLRIYNIHGQLIQEERLVNANNQIQLKGEKGLYFVTLSKQNGEQANFKVIKQ